MTKVKRTDIDPAKIFMQADGFSFAHDRLAELQLAPHQAALIMPAIVNVSAFANELFLKCLLCVELRSRPPGGHHLRDLFDQLQTNTQKEICEIWDREIAPMRRERWDAAERAIGKSKIPRDLPTALLVSKGSFVDLRYAYEGSVDRITFVLTDLPWVLRRVILARHPEWGAFRRPVSELAK